MSEPDYLAQTAEPTTVDERRAWFQKRADEAGAKGATWLRFSVDDADDPRMALVEGWHERPADEGPLNWQMVAK